MPMNPAAIAAFDRAIAIIENPGHITHNDRLEARRELRDLKTALNADLTEM